MNKDSEECRRSDCQDKVIVDNPPDEQENSLDGQSSSSKTCLKLEQVDESLMRALIVKYFTKQKSDSDNTLPEKCDQFWFKDSKEIVGDVSEDEAPSSRFSKLCASNFIRLGSSLIGYPAMSWFQNGDPECPTRLEEFSVDQDGTEPMPVQIWITEKSHPTLHDLKNDAFLKMCAVGEINRSDLMEQHRAYLNIDGNIEYFSKAATQKEGISDFVDHFQQTGNFELNRKEYSASWESIIRALSLTPQYVNSVEGTSDSKHKFQYKGKAEGCDLKKYPVSEDHGLEDITVATKVSSDESSNQMSKSDVPDLSVADSSCGTEDNFKNDEIGVEMTGNNNTKNKGSGKGSPKKSKGPTKDAGPFQGTSTQPDGPKKDPRSSQSYSSKSKSPTEEVNISSSSASSKSKGPENGAESAVKRQRKKRWRGRQKTKGSTSDGSTESSSFPAEVGKTPSTSVAESSSDPSQGKILDEEVVTDDVVQRCIPAFFGKLPSATNGFARHSVANCSSQSDLIGALKLQPVTRSASEQGLSDATAPRSNLLVGAGPSTSKTSAPPLGAIPARASVPLDARSTSTTRDARPSPIQQDVRYFSQEDRSPGVKSVLQYYSNRPDEFGRLVTNSMESMTIDQRTHAINIIWDVLVEGNNNSLCQYTRLSGIRNGPGSGKEVFRMGPSHVSDSLQIGNTGVLTEQSSMSYGFPPSLLTAQTVSKKPSQGFEGATQTQSLPPQKQSAPPVQKKPQSGQDGQKRLPKRRKPRNNTAICQINRRSTSLRSQKRTPTSANVSKRNRFRGWKKTKRSSPPSRLPLGNSFSTNVKRASRKSINMSSTLRTGLRKSKKRLIRKRRKSLNCC
uniref:Uncharacterized protein n=1 Tax=Lygus hesperus TaxID=30085 RepID=A0A0K8SF25_LYGHE